MLGGCFGGEGSRLRGIGVGNAWVEVWARVWLRRGYWYGDKMPAWGFHGSWVTMVEIMEKGREERMLTRNYILTRPEARYRTISCHLISPRPPAKGPSGDHGPALHYSTTESPSMIAGWTTHRPDPDHHLYLALDIALDLNIDIDINRLIAIQLSVPTRCSHINPTLPPNPPPGPLPTSNPSHGNNTNQTISFPKKRGRSEQNRSGGTTFIHSFS